MKVPAVMRDVAPRPHASIESPALNNVQCFDEAPRKPPTTERDYVAVHTAPSDVVLSQAPKAPPPFLKMFHHTDGLPSDAMLHIYGFLTENGSPDKSAILGLSSLCTAVRNNNIVFGKAMCLFLPGFAKSRSLEATRKERLLTEWAARLENMPAELKIDVMRAVYQIRRGLSTEIYGTILRAVETGVKGESPFVSSLKLEVEILRIETFPRYEQGSYLIKALQALEASDLPDTMVTAADDDDPSTKPTRTMRAHLLRLTVKIMRKLETVDFSHDNPLLAMHAVAAKLEEHEYYEAFRDMNLIVAEQAKTQCEEFVRLNEASWKNIVASSCGDREEFLAFAYQASLMVQLPTIRRKLLSAYLADFPKLSVPNACSRLAQVHADIKCFPENERCDVMLELFETLNKLNLKRDHTLRYRMALAIADVPKEQRFEAAVAFSRFIPIVNERGNRPTPRMLYESLMATDECNRYGLFLETVYAEFERLRILSGTMDLPIVPNGHVEDPFF